MVSNAATKPAFIIIASVAGQAMRWNVAFERTSSSYARVLLNSLYSPIFHTSNSRWTRTKSSVEIHAAATPIFSHEPADCQNNARLSQVGTGVFGCVRRQKHQVQVERNGHAACAKGCEQVQRGVFFAQVLFQKHDKIRSFAFVLLALNNRAADGVIFPRNALAAVGGGAYPADDSSTHLSR